MALSCAITRGPLSHVTSAAYPRERGGRITQLQYLLQLSSPTSQNAVKRKFNFPAHDFYVLGWIEPTRKGGSRGIPKATRGKEKEPLGRWTHPTYLP